MLLVFVFSQDSLFTQLSFRSSRFLCLLLYIASTIKTLRRGADIHRNLGILFHRRTDCNIEIICTSTLHRSGRCFSQGAGIEPNARPVPSISRWSASASARERSAGQRRLRPAIYRYSNVPTAVRKSLGKCRKMGIGPRVILHIKSFFCEFPLAK